MVLHLDLVIAFIFGAIVGSFLNVIIFRYNTGRGIRGKSACLSCNSVLQWFELIPLVSFAVLAGRCRTCRGRLSFQYPVVEFLTGLLFALTFWKVGWSPYLLFWWIVFSLGLVIAVYDLRHRIVPDGLVYTLILLSFLFGPIARQSLPDFLAGLAVFLFFFILWRVSGGRWLGLGDGKLATGVAFALGWRSGISAVILAFWLGAAIGVPLLFSRGKRFTMKSEFPFAPFLVSGLILAFLFDISLI